MLGKMKDTKAVPPALPVSKEEVPFLIGVLGAVSAAAIIGLPLGALGGSRPALLGFVAGISAPAIFVAFEKYGAELMLLIVTEFGTFVVACVAFAITGSRLRSSRANRNITA